eukprot:CAMPEP_0171611146 /NCGR_PEP_ID=MMETSP0990-20121206/10457_1 /TAXON_ID=483369 /ORGANISM="non described non described, Strain CCMP2098" /LENGTH=57 /DNA_ID=CAMNT_0012174663 /DNA_START=215 /DNA_END=385 /DNA_ORIENTATION=-
MNPADAESSDGEILLNREDSSAANQAREASKSNSSINPKHERRRNDGKCAAQLGHPW